MSEKFRITGDETGMVLIAGLEMAKRLGSKIPPIIGDLDVSLVVNGVEIPFRETMESILTDAEKELDGRAMKKIRDSVKLTKFYDALNKHSQELTDTVKKELGIDLDKECQCNE